MIGVHVGESSRQLHVIGQRLLDPACEAGDARILKRGVHVSASGRRIVKAELRPAELVDAQRRRIGIQIGKANKSAVWSYATPNTVSQFTSSRRRHEYSHGEGIVKTPSGADNCWMSSLPHVPGHADARPPLTEVSRNSLWHGGGDRSRALANEDRGSKKRSLRLRVPGPIPAQPIGQSKVSGQLPFVLPVEAEVGLIIGEKSCGRSN